MQRLHFVLTMVSLAACLTGCASPSQSVELVDNRTPTSPPEISATTESAKPEPANCKMTVAGGIAFEAPAPYSPEAPFPNEFWFGSEHLWTILPADGIWSGLPHNPEGYTQKILWWSTLFSLKDEPEPNLVVTGERLDEKAPPLNVSRATNASAKDIGAAMLVGVDFPTLGCWKITGQYKKTSLSFIVWVAP